MVLSHPGFDSDNQVKYSCYKHRWWPVTFLINVSGQYETYPDYKYATANMRKDFYEGYLGRVNFDQDLFPSLQAASRKGWQDM